jgi:hypothetical protein
MTTETQLDSNVVNKSVKLEMKIDEESVMSGLARKLFDALSEFFPQEAITDLAEDATEIMENGSLPEMSGSMIEKSLNEELRQGTFVVLEPNVVDLHLDIYDEVEVRKACHNFNQYCERAYLDHQVETEDMTFVESYIAPVDMSIGGVNIVKGTWLAVCQFSPSLWEEVKADPLMGLSIGCYAKTEELV